MLREAYRTFDRFSGFLDRIVQVAIVIMLVVLFSLLNMQVVLRYLIHFPMIWLEELAGFFMAYLTFWGSSSCIRTDRHVRVSFLPDKLKRPVFRHWLSILIHAVLLCYLYYLVVYGYRFAAMGRGEITPSGRFDFFLPRLALTSGGVLMIVQTVTIIFREFIGLLGNSIGTIESPVRPGG